MRDFKGMKRQRGRNRNKGGSGANANNANPNRSWDSQGPENIKVRGNAQTVYERYMQLARDASSSGDRVLAENYTQHAEHYFRVLRALQPARPVSEIAQRELAGQGFDIDFEDETGAQAAAILAAQQAEAERLAREEQRRQEREQGYQNGDQPRREWRERDDREPREPRAEHKPEGDQAEDGQSREGSRDGGRRESRRERWERRREERNRRFETGDAPGEDGDRETAAEPDAQAASDVAPQAADDAAPRRERRPRRPARDADAAEAGDGDAASSALPGFLTRSTAPAPATEPGSSEADAETATPRRRAPRRKPDATAED